MEWQIKAVGPCSHRKYIKKKVVLFFSDILATYHKILRQIPTWNLYENRKNTLVFKKR